MSGKQKAEPGRAKNTRRVADKPVEKKNRSQRTGDIGRALRSVYDDTVREDVPNDFLDLLGKLQ